MGLALLGAALLFATAPHHGEFWWSDSPRHALNGVFVRDLAAAWPRDPAGFAMQYYVRYPALTILLYPPLFYLLSAPFYAVLGVSHSVGLGVVLLHFAALAVGLAGLARRTMRPGPALAVGLLAMAAPGLALWGRQVMLEIPMLALAVWALLLLARYGDGGRPWLLYVGTALLLAAVATKITAAFLIPPAAAMLLAGRGRALLASRHAWTAAALLGVGLLPLAVLTAKFGQANLQSVAGVADRVVARDSLLNWVWYLRELPGLLSWPLLGLAGAGIVAQALWHRGMRRADAVLLATWLVVGYLALSAIDLKEARHATLLLPPLLVAAGLALDRLPGRWRAASCVLALAATAGWTALRAPVPAVAGYAEAAARVTGLAAPGDVVLFSGKRDGSFVFAMRALEAGDKAGPDTLRADKLLLSVAVRRELGVVQKDLSETEIGDLLDRAGVRWVVAQDDFWTDLPVMARLQSVLRGAQFEALAEIPVAATVPVEDRMLRVLRNRHPVVAGERRITLDLPIIGGRVEGRTGQVP